MSTRARKNPRMARRVRDNLLAFDVSKEAYGKRMIQLREGFGLSQKEMAKALGMTPGALNKIEKGKQRLSPINSLILWQKFRFPLQWLIGGIEGDLTQEQRDRLRHGPPRSEEPSS